MVSDRTLAAAIRKAAERQGLRIDVFRQKHGLPPASFYCWLRGKPPVPQRTATALRRLRKAGVKHPILEALAA